jgi:hypothetical protein
MGGILMGKRKKIIKLIDDRIIEIEAIQSLYKPIDVAWTAYKTAKNELLKLRGQLQK